MALGAGLRLLLVTLLPSVAAADLTIRVRSTVALAGSWEDAWLFKGDRYRIPIPGGAIVVDDKRRTEWRLDETSKTYSTERVTSSRPLITCRKGDAAACLRKAGFMRKGSEHVNGLDCELWESSKPGADGTVWTTRVWRTTARPEMQVVREWSSNGRVESQDDVVEMKAGALDAGLFEVPRGWKKVRKGR